MKIRLLILVGILACCHQVTHAADVPSEQPLSSTATLICTKTGPQFVDVVITYQGDRVLRFTASEMHGLDPAQLAELAASAKDFVHYDMGCGGQST